MKLKDFCKTALVFVSACVLGILISMHILTVVRVQGSSMYPTLKSGDLELMYRLDKSYKFGDLIVFKRDGDHLIKRVIGLPRDKVRISEGSLFVNDTEIRESWNVEMPNEELEEVEVKEGTLFVMGDNRSNSLDSRSGRLGLINYSEVLGKIIFK